VLSSSVSDYPLDKEKDDMKCQITPKLIWTFPINTNQLPCKLINVSTWSLGINNFLISFSVHFLADRTKDRAIGTVLHLSSVCDVSYYWEPIGSRIWEIDWYQNEWPWSLFRGRIKVTSINALHLMLNIWETWPQRCYEAVRSAILATAWLLVLIAEVNPTWFLVMFGLRNMD